MTTLLTVGNFHIRQEGNGWRVWDAEYGYSPPYLCGASFSSKAEAVAAAQSGKFMRTHPMSPSVRIHPSYTANDDWESHCGPKKSTKASVDMVNIMLALGSLAMAVVWVLVVVCASGVCS